MKRDWCCGTPFGDPHRTGCPYEPCEDQPIDWAALLNGPAGRLWAIPAMSGEHGAIASEHWHRLIELANTAQTELVARYGYSLVGSLLDVDPNVGYDFDLAFSYATLLAHMVHPYTIAADTGHPTEADYYGWGLR